MANKERPVILAGGQSKFGVRNNSLVDIFREAVTACLNDIPDLSSANIDGLIVLTSYATDCKVDTHTASVIADKLGLAPTSVCACYNSLSLYKDKLIGITPAKKMVEAGQANIILIIGGEKIYTYQRWAGFYQGLTLTGTFAPPMPVDGAAACIITTERIAKSLTERPVVSLDACVQVGFDTRSQHRDAIRIATDKACKTAGLSPHDIKVAQIQGVCSVSGVIMAEELGLCGIGEGEGSKYCASGQIKPHSRLSVNTDDDLVLAGRSFSTTGICQAIEIMKQLQGRARCQVEGADIGLSQTEYNSNIQEVIIYTR